MSVLLGNGDGAFQAAVNTGGLSFPVSVAVGDLNRDDIPDVAVANYESHNVSVLLGQSDGPEPPLDPIAGISDAISYINGLGLDPGTTALLVASAILAAMNF